MATLSSVFAAKLERYREQRELVQKRKKRRRRNRLRALKRQRACITKSNEERARLRAICSRVCSIALALGKNAGRTVQAMNGAWHMVAADYCVEVQAAVARVARRVPRWAALRTAGDRCRFREIVGREFERVGLFPVANYFADFRPAARPGQCLEPDPHFRKLVSRERNLRGAREYQRRRRQLMGDESH